MASQGMIPNASEFTIDKGTFIQAETNITYNITLVSENSRQSNEHVTAQWETLISKVDPFLNRKKADFKDKESKDGESKDGESKGGESKGGESKGSESKDGGFSDDECQDAKSEDDSTTDVPAILKSLIIYTGVDIGAKKLKKATDIVLTLTPAPSDPKRLWPAIVWKTLHFEKTSSVTRKVIWSSQAAFCDVKAGDTAIVKPGDLRIEVNPGYAAVLMVDEVDKMGEEKHTLESVKMGVKSESNCIAVLNATASKRRFALCTINPTKAGTADDMDKYSPVIDLNQIGSVQGNYGFQCTPPVMVQAYALSGHKERELIKTAKLQRPLFPNAIDIRELRQNATFRLYSTNGGQVVLERD